MPRAIVVTDNGRCLLLLSLFDENLDDYADCYDVFEMPELGPNELKGSWIGLENRALKMLGKVPVIETKFDSTKRQEIDLDILKRLECSVS